MKESLKAKITSVGAQAVGGVLLGLGLVIAFESWTTMAEIQGQGILEQAVLQRRYESAWNRFVLGGFGVIAGLVIVAIGAITELKSTLLKFKEE